MSSIDRGTRLWFSQPPTVGGLTGGEHITSTPHHVNVTHTVCDGACATVDIGDDQSAPSSLDVEHVPVTALSDLVKQIGTSIGENIVSCLKSISASDVSMAQQTHTVDLSKANLTVCQDSYEPHPFRGDDSDKLPVSGGRHFGQAAG